MKSKRSQFIQKRIVKSILWLIIAPFILLGLAILIIQIPPVQKRLSKELTTYLTEGTGYRTEIDYINLSWFNSLTLDGAKIYDANENLMIGVEELAVEFKLLSLLGEKGFETQEAWVYKADVNLRYLNDSVGLNINDWVSKLNNLSTSTDSTSSASAFMINEIELVDSKFSIADKRKDSIQQGFNYNQFQLININGDLLNLKAKSDSFNLDVKFLTAEDQGSGMLVEELSAYFRYSTQGMHFLDLNLKTGKSRIAHQISFLYDNPNQMSSFVDSVEILANLDASYLHTDDLSYFAPEVKDFNKGIGISGKYSGKVSDFVGENTELSLGVRTVIAGEMDVEGLPDIKNTFLDLSFKDSQIDPNDIEEFVSVQNYEIIENFGQIKFSGQFDGFINDFVADGQFDTDIGDINSNVKINLAEDIPKYDGYLELVAFDLGRFTEDSLYQKIDMAGNINGSGFRLEDTQFNLVADISRFGVNNYDITRIETDGAIAQSFFSGQLSISDPNLSLFANGFVDLRNNARVFNIIGNVENIALDSLNITDEPLNLSTDFNIDAEGIKLDSLVGNINLSDTELAYRGELLTFDSLKLNSVKRNQNRTISFQSQLIDFNMEGNFYFSTLLEEFNDYKYQYLQYFSGNLKEARRYAQNEGKSDNLFQLEYAFNLKDINPILSLLDSNISVAKNSWIKGQFSSENEESFAIEGYFPSIKYLNTNFVENDFNISGKQISSTDQLDVIAYLYSQAQVYSPNAATQDLTLEAVWDGSHIDLRNSIQDTSANNYAELGADLKFYEQRIELQFEDSNIFAYGETWNIAGDNEIVFTDERISIDSLSIFNLNQSLSFNGAIAVEKDSLETVQINFNELELKNINAVTKQDYEGLLNGKLIVQNLLFDPLFFGDLNLKELHINDFLVGDILGDLNWNDPLKKLEVSFGVNRNEKDIILLNGGIFPRKEEQLDLELQLNNTNLAIAEPYVSAYITDIDGFISGNFNINGDLKNPILIGNGFIEKGKSTINYLNTTYALDGKLSIAKNIIELQDFYFQDVNQNGADFSGSITHNNYTDFKLDLEGDLTAFQVMNLPADQNADFYGEAYATGTVKIEGASSNLKISADARTESDSKIFIPIVKDNNEDVQAEYIQFIDRTDTTANSKAKNIEKSDVEQLKIEGLSLDLNIEVTPDAYAEIIIDPRTGDIIRGRGSGQLRLVIDSDGDFQMTGGLDIEEGAYNFSLYSIINKEFQIEQPSSITWFGDPYAGVLSINAAYNEMTSITPILEQAGFGNLEEGASNLGRRVPVKVLLDLEGPLLSPEISFDIDFGEIQAQDYETVTSINAFKNRIQSDEQELNRQVLSLILLGKFSDQGNVNIVGGAASQSVSQLLSNQLSQLVAQLDENLEIDFDLRDLSEEAFNTMRLRLSYTFLEGRLRVTREGSLTNVQDVNSAVGDWSAEYLLTPDGRYRVKIYYRSNYDYTAGAISQSGTFTTQGVSLTQTSSFNSIKELFKKVEKSRAEANNSESDSGKSNKPSN